VEPGELRLDRREHLEQALLHLTGLRGPQRHPRRVPLRRAHEIAELDLNPVLAFADGVRAVDARVMLAPLGD